jgi:hypothetical protein
MTGSMSKRQGAAELDSGPQLPPGRTQWPFWVKVLVSVLLTWHVAAVFIGPFAFASRSPFPSPFAKGFYEFSRPYLGALYLDHGYFFFAPNPGPSHLVDYKVEFDDGRPPKTGRFPDLKTERPRLLYHRHFMLAEALNNRFVPANPPPEPSPPPLTASAGEKMVYQAGRKEYDEAVNEWKLARQQYEAMQRSFKDHLKHKYGGDRVSITRIEHGLPTADEVQYGGRKLNDPSSYVTLPEALPAGGGR